MQRDQTISYSNIGTWSEAKLELIRKYGTAYSTILSNRPRLTHVYIDAFAGAGMHVSRKTGELVQGSPIQALEIDPPFAEYHFIDTDGEKVEALRLAAGARTGVHIYQGTPMCCFWIACSRRCSTRVSGVRCACSTPTACTWTGGFSRLRDAEVR